MARHFDVVGEDEYDSEPYDVYPEVSGYDVMGPAQAKPRRVRAMPGGGLVSVRQPDWRRGQLAPGVIAPDEGLVPLPMRGTTGVDTFSLAQQAITFAGAIQKPFRGERLLVNVVRTGATAIGRLLGQLFVGTDLQQADISGFDIEQIGNSNAFGVRLTMKPAQPGVAIQIPTRLSSAIAGTDTIFASITLLGRIIY
jgi:hypothetical protein